MPRRSVEDEITSSYPHDIITSVDQLGLWLAAAERFAKATKNNGHNSIALHSARVILEHTANIRAAAKLNTGYGLSWRDDEVDSMMYKLAFSWAEAERLIEDNKRSKIARENSSRTRAKIKKGEKKGVVITKEIIELQRQEFIKKYCRERGWKKDACRFLMIDSHTLRNIYGE